MAKEKFMPAFMVFKEAALMLSLLTDAEAGEVIKSAIHYYLYGECWEVPPRADPVLAQVLDGIDKSFASYKAKVAGGAKGGNAHWNKE